MPGIPGFDPLDPTANLHRQQGFSVGFVGISGDTYSTRFSGLGGAVDLAIGEKMAVVDAFGALSNMGAYKLIEDKTSEIRVADAEAVDEAYANAGAVLSMSFENNDLVKIVVDIPAPDASLFEADGVTLKPRTDATVGTLIGAAIDAAEAAINSTWVPANSFAFVRGIRRSRKVKLPTGTVATPTIIEGSGATAGPA